MSPSISVSLSLCLQSQGSGYFRIINIQSGKCFNPRISGQHNTNPMAQDELMDSCKAVADVIPRLVEGVKMSMQNTDSALAQLNLINNAEQFLIPTSR